MNLGLMVVFLEFVEFLDEKREKLENKMEIIYSKNQYILMAKKRI